MVNNLFLQMVADVMLYWLSHVQTAEDNFIISEKALNYPSYLVSELYHILPRNNQDMTQYKICKGHDLYRSRYKVNLNKDSLILKT